VAVDEEEVGCASMSDAEERPAAYLTVVEGGAMGA